MICAMYHYAVTKHASLTNHSTGINDKQDIGREPGWKHIKSSLIIGQPSWREVHAEQQWLRQNEDSALNSQKASVTWTVFEVCFVYILGGESSCYDIEMWFSIGSGDGYASVQLQAIKWTLGNNLHLNFNQNTVIFIQDKAFKNLICKMSTILFGPLCVNSFRLSDTYTIYASVN